MTTRNRILLTALCFLAYAIMSGLLSQIGIVGESIADAYNRTRSDVAANFAYLSVGITLGSVASLFVYERITLKTGAMLCYAILFFATLLTQVVEEWQLLGPLLFVMGTCASLGVNTGAIILSLTSTPARRASMLLTTDLCFAIAGVVIPPTAAWLITAGFSWSTSFALVGGVALVSVLLASVSKFPLTAKESNPAAPTNVITVPFGLAGTALGAYLLGQVTLLMWLPAYLQETAQMTVLEGAATISAYWVGMAIGQITLALLVIRMAVPPLLLAAATLSIIVSLPLWLLAGFGAYHLLTFCLGLANAGILKLTLSHASTLVDHPQRMVAGLLVCASLGSASAPTLSTNAVEWLGLHGALWLISASYTAAACALSLLLYLRSDASNNSSNRR